MMNKLFKKWYKSTWKIFHLSDSEMIMLTKKEWKDSIKEAFKAGYNYER